MQKIAPDYSFVDTLQQIANKPNSTVGRFKHITSISERGTTLIKIFGVATIIFGTLIAVYPISFSGTLLFILSATCFWISMGGANAESPEQIQEVDKLLNPCIDGMRAAVFEKAQYIYAKVNGKAVFRHDIEKVKKLMQAAAREFAEKTPETARICDIELQLRRITIDNPSAISKYALERLQTLKKTIKVFSEGSGDDHDGGAFLEGSGVELDGGYWSSEDTEHAIVKDPSDLDSRFWQKLR